MMNQFERIYRNIIYEARTKERVKEQETPQSKFQNRFNILYNAFLSKFIDVDDTDSKQQKQIEDLKNKAFNLIQSQRSSHVKNNVKTKFDVVQQLLSKFRKSAINQMIENCPKGVREFAEYLNLPSDKKLDIRSGINNGWRIWKREDIISGIKNNESLKEKNINTQKIANFVIANLDFLCNESALDSGLGEGKGQLLCQTLFNVDEIPKDARGAEKRGDGKIGSEHVEIKANGARIKDHNSFGSWHLVWKTLKEYDVGKDFIKLKDFILKHRSELNNEQFKIKLYNALIYYFKKYENQPIIVNEEKQQTPSIKWNEENGWQDLKEFIDNCFNEEVDIKEEFMILCLKYYQQEDNWKYFIIVNNGRYSDVFKELFISTSDDIGIKAIANYLFKRANLADSQWPKGTGGRDSGIQIIFGTKKNK